MYNDDFVIMVDESGQPYIAHAFGDGFRRAGSKYLEKVKTKSGMWRYLYTPEEVRALGQARKAKKKGVNSTEDLQSYQAAQYKANQARNRVKKNRAQLKEDVKADVKTAKRKTANFIDEHDAGANELRRYRKAKKSGANTSALQAYEKAYKKTALGKAGLAYGKARTTIDKYANTTLTSIRGIPGSISTAIEKGKRRRAAKRNNRNVGADASPKNGSR